MEEMDDDQYEAFIKERTERDRQLFEKLLLPFVSEIAEWALPQEDLTDDADQLLAYEADLAGHALRMSFRAFGKIGADLFSLKEMIEVVRRACRRAANRAGLLTVLDQCWSQILFDDDAEEWLDHGAKMEEGLSRLEGLN